MQSIIRISKLTKKYGEFVAVNNITFDIKEGEIFGLLGPNGAGGEVSIDEFDKIGEEDKSSLLEALCYLRPCGFMLH